MPPIVPKMDILTWTHMKSNEGSSNLPELQDFPPPPAAILSILIIQKLLRFRRLVLIHATHNDWAWTKRDQIKPIIAALFQSSSHFHILVHKPSPILV